MEKTLLAFIFITIISFDVNAQTNVSGGIYSNATWKKANSPYIITDSLVVFPGVSLTIEPGVVVRFDSSKYMELRQSNIFAEGTITDSITFTSNAVVPAPNNYTFYINSYPAKTVAKFNYCNFHYAVRGIYEYYCDSLTIRNSNVTYNNVGLGFEGGKVWVDSSNISNNINEGVANLPGTLNYCTISHNKTGLVALDGKVRNCIFEYNQVGVNGGGISMISSKLKYNQTGVLGTDNFYSINNCIIDSNTVEGIFLQLSFDDTISNSEIKYNNGIGIELRGENIITKCDIENNIIGIKENGQKDSLYCNRICNNSTYDFQHASTSSFSIAKNYWCTTDSATIASHIYDGYDNISLGLLSFMPVDSVCAPGALTSVNEITQDHLIHIYPNPLTSSSTLQLKTQLKDADVIIYDMLGKEMLRKKMNGDRMEIEKGNLESGVYFLKVSTEDKQWVEKIMVE